MANRNYTPNCNTCLKVEDSSSASFSGSGTTQSPLLVNVKISAESGNSISINSDGLFSSGGSGGGGVKRTVITLTQDGSVPVTQGDVIYMIIVTPAGVMPNFQAGTFIGNDSIIWQQNLNPGSNPFAVNYYIVNNNTSIYFQNIIFSTVITIITL